MLNEIRLKNNMRKWLGVIARKAIDDTKPHSLYLPDKGFPRGTPRDLYRLAITAVLRDNGNTVKRWPAKWVDQSIDELAPKLV